AYTGSIWNVSISGGDIGLGVYSAVVSAWLYGYVWQTNTTLNVNITLAPNSFLVLWEPSDQNVTYVEQVNISVIYTFQSLPVPGASVTLILNGTRVYDMGSPGVDDRWHLLLDASTIGLGVWNATVRANQTGYDTGIDTSYITVETDPCSASPNWPSYQLWFTHQINLDVTVLDSIGQPVISALVNATYDGGNYNLIHVGSGVYRLVFNGTDGPGNYTIQVYTFKYGFDNRTFSADLEIIETPISSNLQVQIGGFHNVTLYHDGWIEYRLYIEDGDAIPLTSQTVNLSLGIHFFTMASLGNGTYVYNISAEFLGLGVYSGTLLADSYGYDPFAAPASFTVEAIPARIDVTTGIVPVEMYLNESTTIVVEFVNVHTGQRIDPTTAMLTWSGSSLTFVETSPGQFEFLLDTAGLVIQNHALAIQLSLGNFTTQQINQQVTVRATYTSLTAQLEFSQYQAETVDLMVDFFDTDQQVNIVSGNLEVIIGVLVFPMSHDGDGRYVVSIDLGDAGLAPDDYSIMFSGSALGRDDAFMNSTLHVLAKSSTVLEVILPLSIGEGTSIGIEAILETAGGGAVADVEIIFTITVTYTDGFVDSTINTSFTDRNGRAVLNYEIVLRDVPAETITASASFLGSVEAWSSVSEEQSGPISPTLQHSLLALFTSLPGQLMLVSIAAVVGGGLFYTRKIKPKKRAKFASLDNQLDVFRNLESMQHFMAVYSDRGTCVLYHPFGESRIQPDLVSGFISAITSVYGEITGDGVQGTLEEIHYQGLRLNSYSGQYIIGILILEEELMSKLREGLQTFVQDFEKKYNDDLDGWVGAVDTFDETWILKSLYESMNYVWHLPYRCNPKKKAKGTFERTAVLLKSRSDENGEFRISEVLPSVAEIAGRTEAEALEHLLKMIERGLIESLDIPTFLHREGCSLFGGTELSPMEEPVGEVAEISTVEESVEEPLVEEPEPEDESPEETPEPVEEVEEPEETVESGEPDSEEEESATEDEPSDVAEEIE
ncbi:MAG: hypothetical protein ACXABY_19565, partial [Candidatus Thorarchaeota archaeon]